MGCIIFYLIIGLVVWLFVSMILDYQSLYGTRGFGKEYPYLLALICVLGWPLVVPGAILCWVGYIFYRAFQEGRDLYHRLMNP